MYLTFLDVLSNILDAQSFKQTLGTRELDRLVLRVLRGHLVCVDDLTQLLQHPAVPSDVVLEQDISTGIRPLEEVIFFQTLLYNRGSFVSSPVNHTLNKLLSVLVPDNLLS